MCTPCWCLLNMLAFILYKNADLTPLQITIIVALKPVSSLLSPYWSQAIYQRPDRIISNLVGANLFRHLFFLFIPWMHSSWLIILSFGLYMTLTRATVPAWMELLKQTLPKTKREEVVGHSTTIDFLGTAILAVVMGILLDSYHDVWKWLFSISAGLGIMSTLFLTTVPSLKQNSLTGNRKKFELKNTFLKSFVSLKNIKGKFVSPWKQIIELIFSRKDFMLFQIGFMLGGSGLMIMQPALPKFFVDILHLSFTEIGVALALCKGVGVACTSPFWIRLFRKYNIFRLSALVTFFAMLFPFFLLSASFSIVLLYFAYIFYGVMQSGSELSWHMSGLVFARESDSSTFSSTNVLTVGIRGCFVPAVGSILLSFIHPFGVMLSGALLCLFASIFFLINSRKRLVFTD